MSESATKTTKDKKWSWDRNRQETRNRLVEDAHIQKACDDRVRKAGSDGASITTVLKYIESLYVSIINEDRVEGMDALNELMDLSTTDRRLVIRKILHSSYKKDEYYVVPATSKHRSGKKGKTINYVAKKDAE